MKRRTIFKIDNINDIDKNDMVRSVKDKKIKQVIQISHPNNKYVKGTFITLKDLVGTTYFMDLDTFINQYERIEKYNMLDLIKENKKLKVDVKHYKSELLSTTKKLAEALDEEN